MLNNNGLEMMDALNIASFCIGLMNLEQNITQNDMEDLQQNFNDKLTFSLQDIHNHLAIQDQKINEILEKLRAIK